MVTLYIAQCQLKQERKKKQKKTNKKKTKAGKSKIIGVLQAPGRTFICLGNRGEGNCVLMLLLQVTLLNAGNLESKFVAQGTKPLELRGGQVGSERFWGSINLNSIPSKLNNVRNRQFVVNINFMDYSGDPNSEHSNNGNI